MGVNNALRDIVCLFAAFLVVNGADAQKKVACYQGDENIVSVYNYSLYDIHREHVVNMSQFTGQQEPGANGTEILNSLKYVRPGGGFKPNFTLLEKSDVNGENETPLYTYLKSYCPPVAESFATQDCLITYYPLKTSDVRWNFEKFLINKHGQPVARYNSEYLPQQMEQDIYNLLQEGDDHDEQ